jgi:hypothetical protein
MRRVKFVPLLLSLALFSCAKNQQPQVAERPKLQAIDPTDSTVGLGERILTDGAKLVDSSLPKASKNSFRISSDSDDIIEMNRGGSSTVMIRTSPKSVKSQDVLLGWDGEKKYLVLPLTDKDSIDGKIRFDLKLDSSIEPGLFEVSLAVRDTGGRVSKHLKKWVVIGGNLTNVDSLIVGRWRCVQCSLEGDHSGHFCQFDSSKRFGEWWDLSYYRNNPWKAMAIEAYAQSTEPNWKGQYKVFNDSLPLYDQDGNGGYSYHLKSINSRKLMIRENDHERRSFWVFARVKNSNAE